MRLERVDCNLCGGSSSSSDLITEKEGLSVVRCRGCGLVYVSPRPSAADLASLYRDPSYFQGGDWYLDYLGNEPNYRRLFRRLLDLLERQHPDRGRLLDVGCAAGFLLDTARSDGWQVAGVELSPAMADHAEKRLGLAVHRGELAAAGFADASFDAVTFCDSIEHMTDPLGALAEARRVLRSNGTLLVMTQNVGSSLARCMGRRWPHLTPREHIYYFSAETLRQALEKAGFRPFERRAIGHYWTLGEIVRKLAPPTGRIAAAPAIRRLFAVSLYLNVGDLVMMARAA
jgi:SAM-dependent methyltransferase